MLKIFVYILCIFLLLCSCNRNNNLSTNNMDNKVNTNNLLNENVINDINNEYEMQANNTIEINEENNNQNEELLIGHWLEYNSLYTFYFGGIYESVRLNIENTENIFFDFLIYGTWEINDDILSMTTTTINYPDDGEGYSVQPETYNYKYIFVDNKLILNNSVFIRVEVDFHDNIKILYEEFIRIYGNRN